MSARAFPREARYLIDWNGQSTISYHDFLQAKQFEGSIRYAIDTQTKDLVATNEQLRERGIEVIQEGLDQTFSLLSQGLTVLSHGLEGISDGIERVSGELEEVRASVKEGTRIVTATLQWGFSELLLSFGGLQDSLQQLMATARTPSQTWAYEQFEIARDEFERQLYDEALESLRRAIQGHGSNAGYKTEYRFHFLLGTIRLGSYRNSRPEIVDPAEAESAFVNAARYAELKHPEDAARALTNAGRAAFVQKKFSKALDYTRRALSLSPRYALAHYQIARVCCVDNNVNAGAKALLDAIIIDPELSISASGEAEFILDRHMLTNVIGVATEHFVKLATERFKTFEFAIQRFSDYVFQGVSVHQLMKEEIASLRRTRDEAVKALKTRTLLGAVKAIEILESQEGRFTVLFNQYKEIFAKVLSSAREHNISPEENQGKHIISERSLSLRSTAYALFMVLGAIFIVACLALYGESMPRGPSYGPGAFREMFNTFVVICLIFPSPVWVVMLFLGSRTWKLQSLRNENRRVAEADAARRQQRSEALVARGRERSAEIESAIRRLSQMSQPEFWPRGQ